MAEFTPHQKRIVDRYYTHRDTIMLQKLQELVSEIYLADTERKRQALWKQARTALKNLNVGKDLIEHIVAGQDPKVLASNLQDWISKAGETKNT